MTRDSDIGIIVLSEETGVPLDMNRFVRHINANLKEDTMEDLVALCRAGCRIMEEKLDRAIIRKRIRFTAERLDPIFPRAPFINLEEISIKEGRKWVSLIKDGRVVEGLDDNFYSINYLNEERHAMLKLDHELLRSKVPNFDFSDENKDPQISVTYSAGYSLEGENKLKLPESIECRVLAICSSIYYGSKDSNELLGLKENKNKEEEKKNGKKKDSKEEMLSSQKATQKIGDLGRDMLKEFWFK